jgi:hypothetical protein
MNINLQGSPLFWFVMTSISYIIMEGNRKRMAKIRKEYAEETKNNPYGTEVVLIDFTAILAWILMLIGMVMTFITVGPETTPFEVITIGILALVLGIYVAIKQIAKNKLERRAITFWILRSTEAMSIATALGFWSGIFNHPEARTLVNGAFCLGGNIIMSTLMILFMMGIYLLMNLVGVTINPGEEIFKKHLKLLPIFNPITSFFTIPLWALYWILRKLFRLINTYGKSKP